MIVYNDGSKVKDIDLETALTGLLARILKIITLGERELIINIQVVKITI